MTDEETPLDPIQALVDDNDRRLRALGEIGIGVGGLEHVATMTFFEHMLRALGGEDAVRECKLDLAGRISNLLDPAEEQGMKMREQIAAHERMRRLGLASVGPNPQQGNQPQGFPPGPSPTAR